MNILIAGDYCPNERLAPLIEKENYSFVFGQILPLLSKVDFSIVNFECPVVAANIKPILKQGPNLSCSYKAVEALKWAGFNCVTLANNHFNDYGGEGCVTTFETLQSAGIDYVGGGRTLEEAQRIYYTTINDKILAVVNFCEHEFSIATRKVAGSAPLDLIDNYGQIKEARLNADYVVVIVHGGHEYYQLPSPRMKKTYHWFIELGADIVINHHQHCYSGFEIYKGKPIFYGLGNFCFDGNRCGKDIWNEGYIVSLILDEDRIDYTLIPYTQCSDNPKIELMEEEKKESFYNNIEKINEVINDDSALEHFFDKWCKEQYSNIKYALTPYTNRFMRALWYRGLLPSFLSTKRLVSLYNKIQCEAHRDVLMSYLSQKVKQND